MPVMMVFAKAPLPGAVKTRLAKDVGNINAARIYKKMMRTYLEKICSIPGLTVQLWCSPDVQHPFFMQCARDFDIALYRQSGRDLGCKMSNAFRRNVMFGNNIMLLSGTDIPGIGEDDITQAIEHLENNIDVVLTPTLDGGYGMIAMRSCKTFLFQNMLWSVPNVLQHTCQRIRRRQLSFELLAYKQDIDNRQDYKDYIRKERFTMSGS